MEKNYFPLGKMDDSRIVRFLQIIFGVACIGMAIWWISFNLRSSKEDLSLWVTTIFLAGFGSYMIWAGLGKAARYIIVNQTDIIVKKNSFLSPVNLKAIETARIDIYPLSIVFSDKNGRKYLLRFGTVNYETNEKIVDKIIEFAQVNNIQYEVKEEEL
jgi:hypothetical protein